MAILYKDKNGNIAGIPTGDTTIQVDTLPTASASNVGTIYQYVGTTTSNYIKGYFYQCVEDSSTNPSTYSWVNINVQSGGGQTIQVTSLPPASSANVGTVYQYIGTTTQNYIHNYFYECVLDNGTYKWVNTNVQSGSGGQTIQVDTLPTASVSLEGNIYQYVGASTLTLTNGYFYKCVEGETTGTYEWIEVQVQEGGSGGAIEHITLNGVEQPITNKTVALTVIDNTVNNLVNYYKKTETYTQTEVNNLISAAAFGGFQVVSSLPTQDISTKTIYLVAKIVSETNNVYDEFIYVNNSWENIGDTEIDLTVYQTKNLSSAITVGGISQTTVESALSAINALFASYITTSAFNTTIADYYTKTQVDTTTGDLANLATANKTNLVGAINELNAAGRPRTEVVISATSDFRSAGQGSYSFKTSTAVTITLADANTITIPANIQGIFDVGETDTTLNDYIGLIQYTNNGYEKKIYFTKSVFYLPSTDSVQIDDNNVSSATTYSSSKIETVISSSKASQMTGATAYQDGNAGLVTKPVAGDNQKALFGDGRYHTIYAANTGSTIYVFTSESAYYGKNVSLTDGAVTYTSTFSQTGQAEFTGIAMYGNVIFTSEDSSGNIARGSLNLTYFGVYSVGISSNYATLEISSEDMTLLGVPLAITKNGVTVAETSLKLIDGQLKSTVYLNELGLYKIKGVVSDGTAQTTIAITELKQSYNALLVVAIVYAFKIDDNNSDPSTRVTPYESQYGCENLNYTSAHMNYTSNEFDYGSWTALETCNRNELFFAPKPCMLRYDGTVDYYLDPDDYSKKLDGTTSDVNSISYNGNCMIEFPTVFFKRWQENGFTYVIISNKRIDSDFHAYAHHDKNGIVLPYIYVAAFNAVYDGERARSISGFACHNKNTLTANKIMSNATREREVVLTQANNTINEQGEGHYLLHKAELDMINDLITLITLSTNCGVSIGKGRITGYSSTSNTGIIATGSMNDKGMFWGLNTTSGGVKAFGIEHWYGNMIQSCAGWICNKGSQKVKMTYGEEDGTSTIGFNFTGDGYVTISNSTPSGTNDAGITAYIVSEYGLIPIRASGSSTTYLCDGLSYNNSVVSYARIGGCTNSSESAGIYNTSISVTSTTVSWASGVRITYKGIV